MIYERENRAKIFLYMRSNIMRLERFLAKMMGQNKWPFMYFLFSDNKLYEIISIQGHKKKPSKDIRNNYYY